MTAPAVRLENLVAVHLLRRVHWLEDIHGKKAELRNLRDVVGRLSRARRERNLFDRAGAEVPGRP